MAFTRFLLNVMNCLGVLQYDHVNLIQLRAVFTFIICSAMLLFILIPNVGYLVAFHASEEVYGMTDLMYTIIMFSGILNGYWIIFIRRTSVRGLINELRSAVAKRELTPSRNIYATTALVVDRLSQIYVICTIVGCVGVFVMPYAKPLYHFLIGKYTSASWYTPYKTIIPKAPLGFAFVLLGQQIGGFVALMCVSLTISLHVTLNFYVIAGVNDTQASLKRLDDLIINEIPIMANIQHHLIEILKLNCWIIRFRDKASDTLSGSIFNYIAAGNGIICALLYQFQVSAANKSVQLYQSVGMLFSALTFIFVLCMIGTLVTECSFSIGQSAYASLWYKLPPKYRKHFMLMIQHSHIPFNLTGCGLVNCNLETFVAVVKTAVSVYMVIRNLGS